MEFALDIAWPTFRAYLISLLSPGTEIPEEVDFADLGVTGVTIPGADYEISGGLRFIGPGGLEGDNNFHTEPITIERYWNEFEWMAP